MGVEKNKNIVKFIVFILVNKTHTLFSALLCLTQNKDLSNLCAEETGGNNYFISFYLMFHNKLFIDQKHMTETRIY